MPHILNVGIIMLKSMTGFAGSEAQGNWGRASWEVRSVNHRYLDVTFRLPEGFRALEPELRKLISTVCLRGKIECILKFTPGQTSSELIELNDALVKSLLAVKHKLEDLMAQQQSLDINTIMQWPGVVSMPIDKSASTFEPIKQSFIKVVNILAENRQQEGIAVSQVLSAKLKELEVLIINAKKIFEQGQQVYTAQMQARFEQLKIEVDATRFEQELVILLNKMDVSEELDRLTVHAKSVEKLLLSKKTVGRRLDFMMQELNREANTLGSKSMSSELTELSVEMKVLIEQMREQIQNIE